MVVSEVLRMSCVSIQALDGNAASQTPSPREPPAPEPPAPEPPGLSTRPRSLSEKRDVDMDAGRKAEGPSWPGCLGRLREGVCVQLRCTR